MVEIGKYNTLKIVKDLDFGVYLDGGNGVEILLPTRYVPKNVKPGDEVEVFIYHDNEGRLIATTARPLATVGEFQFMEVKDVNNAGAFLEWGIMKDLLVPFKEQKMPMREGKMVLSLRPVGSCDRTYHGIRTYREVLEQYPYRLRAESRGSVIGSR